MKAKKLNKWILNSILTVSLSVSAMLFCESQSYAYVSSLGNVTATSVSGTQLTLTVDNGAEAGDDILEVKVLKSNIIKFDYRPNGVAASADTPIIDPNKTWAATTATITTTTNPITVKTASATVEITKTPCRVTIKKADGTTLLWESAAGGMYYDAVKFLHATGQNIYGIRGYTFDEADNGIIRNDSTHPAHAGQQGDCGGPFMWSTSGYGVLVDSDGGYPVTENSTGRLEFYYGGTPTEGRRYVKTDMEFYIMLGTPKEIMSSYMEISGKPPLLPKWALGFMNFEWGTNQTETTGNIDTYRAKNIPLDAYAFDYDWKCYGENNYGENRWNTVNFPSASNTALKSLMDSKGVKMIGITKPRIVVQTSAGVTTQQSIDCETNGYWYPGHAQYQDYWIPVQVRSIDPYNANFRTWFWSHARDAYDKGISGWWNDETDRVDSNGTVLWFGNFTSLFMSKAMYDGQRGYDTTKRLWQAARTFYPGTQRYGVTTWSGDIAIQFKTNDVVWWATGMQEQRARMLSEVDMGQARWGMDAGGFNPSTSTPSPELYTRWVQFASFCPVFRVHGHYNHQRQPWVFGANAEDVSKSAIQLRYKLIPYLYAYERSYYDTGLGIVRPLIFDYPADANVSNLVSEWMFGDWLLSAPVVDQAQTSKSIYLPAGTWIDYFRGTSYTGGQTLNYAVNATTLTDTPLFIKKGAIIPNQQVLDYVTQTQIATTNVDIFPNTTASSFTYYDDYGDGYSYESGQYYSQVFTAQDKGTSGYSVTVGAKSGSFTPAMTFYILKVHGKAGTAVTSNGTALTKYANLNALKAASGVEGWSTGKDIYGEVTYVKVLARATSAKSISITGSTTTGITAYNYEAEEASVSGSSLTAKAGTNTNHLNFSGTGFVDKLNNAGAAVTFYANVNTSGTYNIGIRYANGSGTASTISIFVNGVKVKQTSMAALVNWDTWATQTEALSLTGGNNIISIKNDSASSDTGTMCIDYISVPL